MTMQIGKKTKQQWQDMWKKKTKIEQQFSNNDIMRSDKVNE